MLTGNDCFICVRALTTTVFMFLFIAVSKSTAGGPHKANSTSDSTLSNHAIHFSENKSLYMIGNAQNIVMSIK